MNEAIDQPGADQSRQHDLILAASGDHDHEIGELPFDLSDEQVRGVLQRLDVEYSDAHLAGDQ